jgi:hypothetical protein
VNYFQAKCYRNILKTQAAFYSRVSNKEILDKVSIILHGESGRTPMISRQIADKAVILLGHIIRSDRDDHMRRVAIDAEFKRVERSKRRVGRPRFYWLQNTMSRAYKLMRKRQGLERKEFDIRNGFQRTEVAKAAPGREHPFDKKGKKTKIRRSRKNKKERSPKGVMNDKFQKKKKNNTSQHRKMGQRKNKGCDSRKAHQQHNRQGRQQQEANANRNRSVGITQREERELISLKANTARFFATIGCGFTLSLKGIKGAYRKKALEMHPKGGSVQGFQQLGAHLEKITIAVSTFLQKYRSNHVN